MSGSSEWRPSVRPLGGLAASGSHGAIMQTDATLPIHDSTSLALSVVVPHSTCMLRPKGVHMVWLPGGLTIKLGVGLHPSTLGPACPPSTTCCGLLTQWPLMLTRPFNFTDW